MPYGVTPAGFVKKTLLASRDAILLFWRDNISSGIDTSEDGLEAQLAGAFAEEIAEAWDAQEAEYAARDPAQAEGQALDDLLHLRGIYRKSATQSLVTVDVTLDAGTYPAGDLVATVSGDPSARFANDEEITTAGGVVTTVFRAESDGPVHANANTLTVPTSSGMSAINNPNDAILGRDIELDAEYYARSELELGAEGSTTGDAIRAAVLALDGVTYARVYVNDEPTTDSNGVLPNSVEAVVLGGDDDEIRHALLNSKAAGIRARGVSNDYINDTQGNNYLVGFTRPTRIQPYLVVVPHVNLDLYPGDAAVKAMLLDWGDSNLSVGNDVIIMKIAQLVMALPGVYDVEVLIDGAGWPDPGDTDNFVIGVREYADLDTTRVNVVNEAETGPA